MQKSNMRWFWSAVVIMAVVFYLPRFFDIQEPQPRGKLIFFTRDGRAGLIRERDLKTGKAVTLFTGPILEVGGSNSELLIVRPDGTGVEIVSFSPHERSNTTLIRLSSRPTVVLPRLSPDGSLLGYLSTSSPARLEVMNRRTKEPLTSLEFSDEISSLEFLTNDRLAATVGSPPNFTLHFIDLGTKEEKRLPEVIGGTLSRVDERTLLLSLFDPATKVSVIGRIGLMGEPKELTSGPFDDHPLLINAQAFVFHRVAEGAERRDELVLNENGQEAVLTEGLIPLLFRD